MTYLLSQPSLQAQPHELRGSPAKTLYQLLGEGRSGRLTIGDPGDPSIGWRVYFGGGQIHFAESTMGHPERLPYLLGLLAPQLKSSQPQSGTSCYPSLCQLWQSQQLTLDQLRNLLTEITQEALIQLLAIPETWLRFDPNVRLDPILIATSFWDLILPIEERIGQWELIRSEMSSPFQRPFIRNWETFTRFVGYVTDKCQHLQQLMAALGKGLCLYQLANHLETNTKDLAVAIHALIKCGAVGVHPYQAYQYPLSPIISCVDDRKSTQRLVKLALEPLGYEVNSLMHPTQAFSVLSQAPPDMILINGQMHGVNAYRLCRKLRQLEQTKPLPIVMMTKTSGIKERIRTYLCGGTTMLPIPLHPKVLRAVVQKHNPVLPRDFNREVDENRLMWA